MTTETATLVLAGAAVVSAALTVVLVIVNIVYAWQNRQVVNEMRAARLGAVVPHLAPTAVWFAPNMATLRVVNVGPGAALAVDLRLRLEPGPWQIRYLVPYMAVGESHDFYPAQDPADPNGASPIMRIPELAAFERLRITGTMRDVAGVGHAIEASFDIREWAGIVQTAGHARDVDQLKRIADELERGRKLAEGADRDRQSDRWSTRTTRREWLGWRWEIWQSQHPRAIHRLKAPSRLLGRVRRAGTDRG